MKSTTSNKRLHIFHRIQNPIKSMKSSIRLLPSHCTRLPHADETQTAELEPTDPHNSNRPSPIRGATASQRYPKAEQSVRSTPLRGAQGQHSVTKHLV